MIAKRIVHPGLIFPDSPLHKNNDPVNGTGEKRKGSAPKRPIDTKVPANWGITTEQISRKLGISASAVRQYLHRRHVSYKLIRQPLMGPALLFWNKNQVLPLLNSYPKPQDKLPEGYITSKEAAMLLGVSNTTLLRLTERHKITTKLIKYHRGDQDTGRLNRVYERESLLEVMKQYRSAHFYACVN